MALYGLNETREVVSGLGVSEVCITPFVMEKTKTLWLLHKLNIS